MREPLIPQPLLLVDDDVTFCEVLGSALSKRGFTVATATGIDQALATADKLVPEYAVVDLRIGQESGLNLVAELKARHESLRIVILTGYASIATAVEAIKLGANHYLTKPADVDEIVRALNREGTGDPDVEPANAPVSVKRLEWEHLQKVLLDHDGNISAAARALGMHRRTLQRKLAKHPVKK
ncbi:MAG: response regulator transcription factor [Gammaproteobacteria bacterium]|nr:response regulator transcription factor [Gammaproteobacteria bacterium]